MALLSGSQLIPVALGFAVVGALLVVSYTHKLSTENYSGVTSEVSALGTYLLGALVYHDQLWIATTITVISMFLLVLKTTLEGLTQRVPPDEIFTFTKFLLLTAVILPVLPRAEFTPFQINPFKTWLVVVAVSSVSYGSYLLLKVTHGRNGVLLSALLGGAYSSTVTTIALARRSASEQQQHLFSGGTLIASGMMYLRLALLVALFNRALLRVLDVEEIDGACSQDQSDDGTWDSCRNAPTNDEREQCEDGKGRCFERKRVERASQCFDAEPENARDLVEVQTEKIFYLRTCDQDGDAVGKSDNNGPRDELHCRAKSRDTHDHQQNSRHDGAHE